jgi:hypothetical protein
VLNSNRGADFIFLFGFLPFAGYGGGADRSILDYCTIISNSASAGGGVSESKLRNCLLLGNVATGGNYNGRAGGGGAVVSTLLGCTIVGNSDRDFSTGGGGAIDCNLKNCIAYFNNGPNNPNYASGFSRLMSLDYSCTLPMPTNGVGNITNAPLFLDTNGWANLRLQSNSPCINVGANGFAFGNVDLDGRPRIVGGTVDMGAYESQANVSGEFIGWLGQYGLPTDGTADYSDSDGDQVSNWQEWIAGTIPTDASSLLRLLPPATGSSSVTVTWQSVSNRTYFIERAKYLGAAEPFSLMAGNIPGLPGTTSIIDTNGANAFYRVGIQQ